MTQNSHEKPLVGGLHHDENAREGLLRALADFPDQLHRELPAESYELPQARYPERCRARKDSLGLQMGECSRQTLVIKQQGKENNYISQRPPSVARDSAIATRISENHTRTRTLDRGTLQGVWLTLRDLLSAVKMAEQTSPWKTQSVIAFSLLFRTE